MHSCIYKLFFTYDHRGSLCGAVANIGDCLNIFSLCHWMLKKYLNRLDILLAKNQESFIKHSCSLLNIKVLVILCINRLTKQIFYNGELSWHCG